MSCRNGRSWPYRSGCRRSPHRHTTYPRRRSRRCRCCTPCRPVRTTWRTNRSSPGRHAYRRSTARLASGRTLSDSSGMPARICLRRSSAWSRMRCRTRRSSSCPNRASHNTRRHRRRRRRASGWRCTCCRTRRPSTPVAARTRHRRRRSSRCRCPCSRSMPRRRRGRRVVARSRTSTSTRPRRTRDRVRTRRRTRRSCRGPPSRRCTIDRTASCPLRSSSRTSRRSRRCLGGRRCRTRRSFSHPSRARRTFRRMATARERRRYPALCPGRHMKPAPTSRAQSQRPSSLLARPRAVPDDCAGPLALGSGALVKFST